MEDRAPELEALLPIERAFADFCRKVNDRAMARAEYCLRDYDAAGEAVQDALFEFYPRWKELIPEEWEDEFQVTLHRSISKHRKSRRKHAERHVPLDEATEQALVYAGELEPRVSFLLSECLEMERLFQEALEALSDREREVWILHKHTRLSHKEIAAELNITENTVVNTMGRAKKTLNAFCARAGIRLTAETAKSLVPPARHRKLLPAETPEARHG